MSVRRGMTLIELVASMAITTIILAALSSAVMVAGGARPKESAERSSRAMQQMDRMFLDISEAIRVRTSGSTSIRILVPDRTGNGSPEEIVYGWVGIHGGTIIRSQNGVVSEFMRNVESFNVNLLTYQVHDSNVTNFNYVLANGVQIEFKLTELQPVVREIRLHAEPPVLNGWVRADFDSLPQQVDWDRESGNDWSVTSGSIGSSDIVEGWWVCRGTLRLESRWNFTEPTIVSTRVRITRDGKNAYLRLIGDCTALSYVDLELEIRREKSDRTRVRVYEYGLSSKTTLISQTTQGGVLEISMVLRPASKQVALIINGQLEAEAGYSTRLGVLPSGSLTVSSDDHRIEYDWVELRVGGTE